MPRTKPTEKLGVYGQYDINPEKAVELYTESKAQNKYYIKEPFWDVPREGIEFSAIQNEREFEEKLHQQTELRKKLQIDAKLNEKRIGEMFRIQDALREQFIDVNDFISDCEEKEQIAAEKIKTELKLHENLTTEIEEIKTDLNVLSEFHNELQDTVKQFQPYEDVIQKVVDESDLYKSVEDLIQRCDALMIGQVEIAEMEKCKVKEIEEMREKMVTATNTAALTVMGLNNELAELERCYVSSKAESIKWAKILSSTKNCIAEKETLTFRLLDQIQQLYGLFCKRSGTDRVYARHQVEEQLDFIKEEMDCFQEIIKKSNELIAEEEKSKIAVKGSCTSKKCDKKTSNKK